MTFAWFCIHVPYPCSVLSAADSDKRHPSIAAGLSYTEGSSPLPMDQAATKSDAYWSWWMGVSTKATCIWAWVFSLTGHDLVWWLRSSQVGDAPSVWRYKRTVDTYLWPGNVRSRVDKSTRAGLTLVWVCWEQVEHDVIVVQYIKLLVKYCTPHLLILGYLTYTKVLQPIAF